jgi:Domain of unknown function (DUF3854)
LTNHNPNSDNTTPSNGKKSGAARTLSPEHRRALQEESAIAPEIISERGYFTSTDPAELEELGFARFQRRVPALVIPVHGVNGECRFHRARPDDPREDADKPGKFTKYEQPAKTGVALDVPPQARSALSDPSKRLWIVEGEKKADSLVSHGECAIDVLGVWSWKREGRPLPDWDNIRLVGREILIAFDSDAERNAQVRLARSALASYLKSRGATVKIVKLHDKEDGSKVGVDDFFAAGYGVDDLLSHASTELREQHAGEDEDPPAVYLATPQGIVWNKPTRHGTSPTPLTNFVAEIISDVVEDDGAEEKHTFEIEARPRERQRRFEVPASRFASMNWVAEHLGASAFVYPGFGYEKHAAVAIQSLSGEITERRYFAHTGWRKIEGEWAYLHAGGAIGPKGPLTGVEVAMGDGRLGDCLLPEPPENTALVEAVRASLRFLDLAPPGWCTRCSRPFTVPLSVRRRRWISRCTSSARRVRTRPNSRPWPRPTTAQRSTAATSQATGSPRTTPLRSKPSCSRTPSSSSMTSPLREPRATWPVCTAGLTAWCGHKATGRAAAGCGQTEPCVPSTIRAASSSPAARIRPAGRACGPGCLSRRYPLATSTWTF